MGSIRRRERSADVVFLLWFLRPADAGRPPRKPPNRIAYASSDARAARVCRGSGHTGVAEKRGWKSASRLICERLRQNRCSAPVVSRMQSRSERYSQRAPKSLRPSAQINADLVSLFHQNDAMRHNRTHAIQQSFQPFRTLLPLGEFEWAYAVVPRRPRLCLVRQRRDCNNFNNQVGMCKRCNSDHL